MRTVLLRAAALALGVLALSGCPSVKLVADYDEKTYEESIRIGKEVDLFYGRMLETPNDQRAYSKYAAQYIEIESDIRSLLRRNRARPLNEESTRITAQIDDFWVTYRCWHKNRDRGQQLKGDETCDRKDECAAGSDAIKSACKARKGYPQAAIHRARFARLFDAAASAEEAKKVSVKEKPEDGEAQ